MLVVLDGLRWPVYGQKAYRWKLMKEFDEPDPGRGVLAPYIGLYLQGDILAEQDALIDKWSLAGEEHPEPTRTYMPLDGNHPTLFLQFAATPPTKQGILGFIDKFGILGLSYSSKIGGDRLVGVEPIEVWETEITTLRDCLAYTNLH